MRTCAYIAAAAVLLFLSSCSDAGTGPSSDNQVVGTWAGQVDAQGVPVLLQLDIAAAHNYTVTMTAAGDLVEREKGSWATRGGRWVTTPATCESADQVGGPLHLVACTGPDSVAINITGDTWRLNFTAGGELVTFDLKRL